MDTDLNELHGTILDLTGLFNRPEQDAYLLEKAGVVLDRALFPILSRVGSGGAPTIDELAGLAGRDQSTVSRQVAKLEQLGLVTRCVSAEDRRRRAVIATEQGRKVLAMIGQTRNEILKTVLQDWSASEKNALIQSLRHFVSAIRRLSTDVAPQPHQP